MAERYFYHFINEDRQLSYGDNRKVKVGTNYVVTFPYRGYDRYYHQPTLCEAGLHASRKLEDAFRYAKGLILCKVRLSGDVVHGGDKSVASERYVAAMLDLQPVIKEFAQWVLDDMRQLRARSATAQGVTDMATKFSKNPCARNFRGLIEEYIYFKNSYRGKKEVPDPWKVFKKMMNKAKWEK